MNSFYDVILFFGACSLLTYFCYLWEKQIYLRQEIVDIGFVLTKQLYSRAVRLSQKTIQIINIFFGLAAIICIFFTCLYAAFYDQKIIFMSAFGYIIRCFTGTLTQLPCPKENFKFAIGELGGLGDNRSMIWIFSGHCFALQMAIYTLGSYDNMVEGYGFLFKVLLMIIQGFQIIWFLSTRAHYSIDMFIGCCMPYVLHLIFFWR